MVQPVSYNAQIGKTKSLYIASECMEDCLSQYYYLTVFLKRVFLFYVGGDFRLSLSVYQELILIHCKMTE